MVRPAHRSVFGGFSATGLVLGLSVLCAAAQVVYVDDDAPPGGNGAQWATAFRYLQDALAAAQAGSEIRIGQGTYLPDRDAAHPAGTGLRTARFQVNGVLVLRGGYAGFGAPDPDARDIDRYPSILSGDLAGNDQPGFQGLEENAYKVVYFDTAGPGSLLEGVTIRGGNADQPGTPFNLRGGGMYIVRGAPAVVQCTFVANSAGGYGQPDGNGGGLYITTGHPVVSHCRFVQNRATSGAGLYVNQTDPSISDCEFRENTAGGGGGIRSFAGASRVTRCQFLSNTASQWGGGVDVLGGTALLTDCLFDANISAVNGGGLCVSATVTVFNSRFVRNWADWYGSGIYNSYVGVLGSNVTVANCLFWDNVGSAITNWPSGTPNLVHASLRQCTLIHNGVGVGDAEGVRPSELNGCIVWANGDGSESNQLYGSGFTIDYSCVQGWSGQFGGVGNVGDDPRLIDLLGGDYHLLADSPCIDHGDPNVLPSAADRDLDGQLRVWDGDGNGSDWIDMGADEFGSHLLGDENCDGSINFSDINAFVLALTDPDAYAREFPSCRRILADINTDGRIDFGDINPFVALLVGPT